MTAVRLRPERLVAPGACALALGLGYAAAQNPLLTVAAAGAGMLAYLVLARAEVMLLLLVAMLPWESLLDYPSEQVSVVKIAGLLLGLAYLLRAAAGRAPLQVTKTLMVVGGFLCLIGLSLMSSPGDIVEGVGKVLRYALYAVFFFLLVQLAAERVVIVRVLKVFVVSLTLAAVYGIVVSVQVEGAFAGGPIEDPNDFGYLLVTTVPLGVFLALEERPRWLWAACVAVLFAGMLATLSRGALAGLAGLLIWAVATRRVRLPGLVAAAAVMGGIVALGFSLAAPVIEQRLDAKRVVAAENASSRLAYWSAAVAMAAERPLTGVGPGRFGEESVNYIRAETTQRLREPVTHNSYLEVLAESGLPALLAFLALLAGTGVTLRRVRARYRERGDDRGARLASALQGALVAAVVAGMFLSAAVIVAFWLVTGLAAALARDHRVYPQRPGSGHAPS